MATCSLIASLTTTPSIAGILVTGEKLFFDSYRMNSGILERDRQWFVTIKGESLFDSLVIDPAADTTLTGKRYIVFW